MSISSFAVGETGFREILKSGKLDALEKELQLSQESKLIEEFMEKVSKGLAEYGEEKIKDALNLGAVDKLIVSESFLLENRDKTEELMDLAEGVRAETHIISSKNPNEEQISGFGGIVAILRYKLE